MNEEFFMLYSFIVVYLQPKSYGRLGLYETQKLAFTLVDTYWYLNERNYANY